LVVGDGVWYCFDVALYGYNAVCCADNVAGIVIGKFLRHIYGCCLQLIVEVNLNGKGIGKLHLATYRGIYHCGNKAQCGRRSIFRSILPQSKIAGGFFFDVRSGRK